MAKILAFDQASRITGYAFFDDDKLVKWGKITLDDTNFGMRLVQLREKVYDLIKDFNPDEIIFEDIQLQANVGNNVDTFKKLAEVFGIIYELATELNIPNRAVLSTVWKSTLGIKGRTRPDQKKNAQKFVQDTYGIKATQDECDAICIGTHAMKKSTIQADPFDWSD